MKPEMTLSEIYPNDSDCVFDSIALNITPELLIPTHTNTYYYTIIILRYIRL
jgi:hypothetical protein